MLLVSIALTLCGFTDPPSGTGGGPSQAVPGELKCGLGKDFHQGRRNALLAEVEEGVVLFRGLGDTRGYEPFHQDKVFWYLTGVESPNAALLMDKSSGRQILFLPEVSEMSEMWEGEKWDMKDRWVKGLTGFNEILPERDLLGVLEELTAKEKTVWTAQHPHITLAECFDRARPFNARRERDPLDGRVSREKALKAQLEERFGVKVRSITPMLNELRRVKQPVEIDAMRRAAAAGVSALQEAMRSTKPGVGEWELDGLMTFIHRKAGAAGPAYHAIVGGGANSLVLHYSACDRRVQDGEVILIDYAPEFDHYTSDITRTWPVSGVFTERMAEIYDAVKDAQAAGILAAKPGAKISDVENACAQVLRDRGFGHLVRHASCHYIGMEVHDVGRSNRVLEVGVAFTVEPGLYEPETGIGVRIEDVVVITEDGCENLSAGAPRGRAEIEALIAEQGLLEWMAEGKR